MAPEKCPLHFNRRDGQMCWISFAFVLLREHQRQPRFSRSRRWSLQPEEPLCVALAFLVSLCWAANDVLRQQLNSNWLKCHCSGDSQWLEMASTEWLTRGQGLDGSSESLRDHKLPPFVSILGKAWLGSGLNS